MFESYKLLFATGNPGKVRELEHYLADLPVTIVQTSDLADPPEVEEDRDSLKGNARKKAASLHRFSALPTVADDTGLEVDALNGRPGVYSARLAGPDASDRQNRERLLEELADVNQRKAQFRTVLAFVDDDGVRYFEGICSGHILREERGAKGFGYDSLFVPHGRRRSFAQMSEAEKNQISHRGKALQKFARLLKERLGTSNHSTEG